MKLPWQSAVAVRGQAKSSRYSDIAYATNPDGCAGLCTKRGIIWSHSTDPNHQITINAFMTAKSLGMNKWTRGHVLSWLHEVLIQHGKGRLPRTEISPSLDGGQYNHVTNISPFIRFPKLCMCNWRCLLLEFNLLSTPYGNYYRNI